MKDIITTCIMNTVINKDNLKLGVELALCEKNILLDSEIYNKIKEQCIEQSKFSIENTNCIGTYIKFAEFNYPIDDDINFSNLLKRTFSKESNLIINTDLIDVSIKTDTLEEPFDYISINLEAIALFSNDPRTRIKNK